MTLNFFFLAFCGVSYKNLLHRWVYIAVSSSKLLFRQFCEKPLHITFKQATDYNVRKYCYVWYDCDVCCWPCCTQRHAVVEHRKLVSNNVDKVS